MIVIDTPTLATISFFLAFFGLTFAGVPLAISLGLSSLITAFVVGGVSPYLLVKAFYYPFSSFTLIAIYLFVFMGVVFYRTGLASLLVELLHPLLGRRRFGLPVISILASAMFGLLTGSAVATAGTFSALLGKEMEKKNYPREHVVALISAAAPLGALIPPSIPALVLSVSTNTSVLTNFAVVGALGIELTIFLVIFEIFLCEKRKYGVTEALTYTRRQFLINILKALPLLAVPLGVLGSIYLGFLSVSEAGAVGGFLALVLAAAYRRLNRETFINIAVDSASTTASVFFLISASYMLSYVWGMAKVYVVVNNFLTFLSGIAPVLTLIAVAILLLILGMFMDLIIFNITLAPIIIAALKPLGVNPYHVNALFAVGNLIGTVTPPVGTVLATTVKIMNTQIDSKVIKETWILLIPNLIQYVLIIFIPDLALWLPRLLGLPT